MLFLCFGVCEWCERWQNKRIPPSVNSRRSDSPKSSPSKVEGVMVDADLLKDLLTRIYRSISRVFLSLRRQRLFSGYKTTLNHPGLFLTLLYCLKAKKLCMLYIFRFKKHKMKRLKWTTRKPPKISGIHKVNLRCLSLTYSIPSWTKRTILNPKISDNIFPFAGDLKESEKRPVKRSHMTMNTQESLQEPSPQDG